MKLAGNGMHVRCVLAVLCIIFRAFNRQKLAEYLARWIAIKGTWRFVPTFASSKHPMEAGWKKHKVFIYMSLLCCWFVNRMHGFSILEKGFKLRWTSTGIIGNPMRHSHDHECNPFDFHDIHMTCMWLQNGAGMASIWHMSSIVQDLIPKPKLRLSCWLVFIFYSECDNNITPPLSNQPHGCPVPLRWQRWRYRSCTCATSRGSWGMAVWWDIGLWQQWWQCFWFWFRRCWVPRLWWLFPFLKLLNWGTFGFGLLNVFPMLFLAVRCQSTDIHYNLFTYFASTSE